MWKFKQLTGKEPTGLEGKTIDIGNAKIQIQNVIAEGGFSSVYLARDAINISKHYALKHLICQDGESLELAMKEISVMKLLKGHPNVVKLVAHTILDMGRRKEALLVMEFCEKSLVNVLENRGGEFVEKQILLIFRDVCNAVFAMHSQTPPIAHRDLKAENILLGSDGSWKLCDFGSTSTNHKCFDKPEEMGIEEDNIRKHTTPAYRSPEMWDLYRKDVISEKVDIWALGCLLFKLCYSKLAFDGESKLQILNGNYRIPNMPKYSEPLIKLIKDMLANSPVDRPDITQVWFRVNELLPVESQKDLPDGSISASAIDNHSPSSVVHDEGTQKRSPAMPSRSPPPPPSKEQNHGTPTFTSNKGGASMGAFWSTQHAQNAQVKEDKNIHKNADFEISFSPEEKSKPKYGNEAFNTFVADFDTANNINSVSKSKREEELEAEVASLREKLKQANVEKDEITIKFEKLSAICRSQRQELVELKRNLSSSTPSPASKDNSKTPETPQREKIEGTVWELQQGMFQNSPSPPDSKPWNAFAEVPKQQTPIQAPSPTQTVSPTRTPKTTNSKSVRTSTNGHRSSLKSQTPPSIAIGEWGFGHDSFKAAASGPSSAGSETLKKSSGKNEGEVRKVQSNQPAGWAGF